MVPRALQQGVGIPAPSHPRCFCSTCLVAAVHASAHHQRPSTGSPQVAMATGYQLSCRVGRGR